MTADLIIVGASVRAAAQSAVQAGFSPWCADLFADIDLRALVPGSVRCPVARYPRALAEIVAAAPPCPWMYTGALENHPNLIRRMAEVRPLWGNGPAALAACRSPFTVNYLLRDAGLPTPDVRPAGADLPGSCDWLRKPFSGSAGQGIGLSSRLGSNSPRGHYYQQFVSGVPMSAVFVRARGEVQLIGATEQLIGIDWLGASAFRYCGNIGPVRMDADLQTDLVAIGRVLGDGCDLRGVFGIDFVLHAGRPWVVEVNPRYPASVEVIERATGVSVLSLHRMAFDRAATATPGESIAGRVGGKAILYTSRQFEMPADPLHAVTGNPDRDSVQFADIPASGELIETGWPILTILVSARSRDGCLTALASTALKLREHLKRSIPL